MPEALDFSIYVTRNGPNAHMDLAVEGVSCAGCMRKIEAGLRRVPGIVDARLNFTTRRLAVDWRPGALDAQDVLCAIERIGYRAHPFEPQRTDDEDTRISAWLVRCLAVAGFAGMNIMLLSVSVWSGEAADMSPELRDLFHWISALIALPCAAYAGQPFFRSALRAIRARQLNMDAPISLGVLLALGMSVAETANHAGHVYFDSAIMLLFFLLCGRYLDHAMRRKTRSLAGNLAALKAEVAHRFERDHELVTVPAAALRPGDRLLVRPGEHIPADGVIISGNSQVDEGLVTGETTPRKVGPGATIYAATVNHAGALTMRVTAVGSGTLVDDIERLLANALTSRSTYLQLAERAACLYAPLVHATAAFTLVGWLIAGASLHDSIITAIAVLIITCPCAIALAVPAVQVVASGALLRAGIILKSKDAIERLSEIDTVVFDKTGTLTLPEPRVANSAAIDPDLLETAARLALSSRHPLAAAVAMEARQRIPFEGAVEEPGRGVRVRIDGAQARLGSPEFCGLPAGASYRDAGATSVMAFSHAGRTALLEISQRLRPDAEAVMAALRERGLEIRILSGDRPAAVAPIARMLAVREWRAGMSPVDKIACIKDLKACGRRVLMVGDGLNDAPALAAAHVSVSPISAAHLAQAHADTVFLGDRLHPVLEAVTIARGARALMRQNLVLAAVYNAVAVPIAIAGLITPLIAAAAMSGSSLLVTANALRARARRNRAAPVRLLAERNEELSRA